MLFRSGGVVVEATVWKVEVVVEEVDSDLLLVGLTSLILKSSKSAKSDESSCVALLPKFSSEGTVGEVVVVVVVAQNEVVVVVVVVVTVAVVVVIVVVFVGAIVVAAEAVAAVVVVV